MAVNGQAPLDVLTVGDGNFSFSLAYLRKHSATIRLVATSYDAYDELIDKYPESARICTHLNELGATVLHRIDATNLDVSLRNATDDSSIYTRRFDRVIFNHPHCGEENVQRHQSLLSHFFVSAQRVLKRDSGRIHLTLAEGQPERWEARERAVCAGMRLEKEIDDVDGDEEHAVDYERKRHQNGRSFHRVLLHGERKQQVSTLFVFAIADVPTVDGDQHNEPVSAAEPIPTTRKRKLRDQIEDVGLTNASRQGQLSSSFECEPCQKTFKTAQGLKTHVHMVHELGVAGEVSAKSKSQLPCRHCERTFRNEEARRQHEIAKHGEDSSIRPDWFRPLTGASDTTTTSEQQPTSSTHTNHSKTCSICGLAFPDETAFDDHWQELQPKTVRRRECSLCGKTFEEERAIRQHQNFCRIKAVEQNEVVNESR